MRTSGRSILVPALILAAVGAFSLLNPGSNFALHGPTPGEAVARLQVITPTPAPEEGSTAGSTDGIMWMAVAIVVIILVPVVLRILTLPKS